MKRHVRRTLQVRTDLIAIYGFIHERSPQAAEEVLDVIERNLQSMLETPGIGRRWHSADPRLEGLRIGVVTPYRNYLVFFREASFGIEVFRVVHGARELNRLVEEIELEFEDE